MSALPTLAPPSGDLERTFAAPTIPPPPALLDGFGELPELEAAGLSPEEVDLYLAVSVLLAAW